MTSYSLFLQSYGIGFVAAAALGPIGLVLIQRTIRHGWRAGAASGLGVALADGLFGLVGALGLAALTSLLEEYHFWIRFVGGGLLVYIGLKGFLTAKQQTGLSPEEIQANSSGVSSFSGLAGAATTIFLLTLTNPVTVMFFSAIFAGLPAVSSFTTEAGWSGPFNFGGGIFLGSLSWWLILSSLVAAARQRFQLERMTWLNRLSGLLIAGFGVWVWLQLLA